MNKVISNLCIEDSDKHNHSKHSHLVNLLNEFDAIKTVNNEFLFEALEMELKNLDEEEKYHVPMSSRIA